MKPTVRTAPCHGRRPMLYDLVRGGLLGAALLGAAAANATPPPFVVLMSPPNGTLLSEGDTIQLQTMAGNTVLKVEFYVDGTLLGEVSPAPFALSWSNVVIGTHTLHAVAVDDALARATSAVVSVTVEAPRPRMLFWSSYTQGDWNRSAVQWRVDGRPTVFHDGDSVDIYSSAGVVFIGTAGVPESVAPAAVTLRGACGFHGGDILTGSLTVMDPGPVTFSNYSGSLSFPGGTMIQPPSGAVLTYDVSGAPNGAVLHFGTGPITLRSTFALQMGSNRVVTLENDFVVGVGATLSVNPMGKANAGGRFVGRLDWGGPLIINLSIPGGGSGTGDNPPHEWAGPVVLDQSSTRDLSLYVRGYYIGQGLLISGNISDGPGAGTNRLRFASYPAPPIRLAGSNTYAGGTLVQYGNTGPLEVGPASSLGTGDVEVDSGGVLRLMGNGNIASRARVTVRGRVILDPGVKIRVSSLTLGPNTYTAGLFTLTNSSGYLRSNGTFRLPAQNLLPTVSVTHPPDGATLVTRDTIALQAAVADVDSYLRRVEFRVNGALFGVRTNAPYELSLRNVPAGRYRLQAVAYDDDGGVSTPAEANIAVAPRIDHIESQDGPQVVLDFNSPMNHLCVLEATDTLSPPGWTNLATFPAEPLPRPWRLTNALPPGVTTRYYRLVLP